MDLLPETAKRLATAQAGQDVARHLRIGELEPGDVGVLDATVVQVAPPRTFRRRNGSEGLVGRATLGDGSGEIDVVLWDDDNRLCRDGTLAPGRRVTLRGAQCKAGYRGGIELSIEGARIDAHEGGATSDIAGTVESIGDTRAIDRRFQADITMRCGDATIMVVVWDDLVKHVRDLGVGGELRLDGVTPHPVLDGWFLADGARLA